MLYYKRLEQGTILTPKDAQNELNWSDLILMVEGIHVVKSIQKNVYSREYHVYKSQKPLSAVPTDL